MWWVVCDGVYCYVHIGKLDECTIVRATCVQVPLLLHLTNTAR